MAHTFVKEMLDNQSRHFRVWLIISMTGGFLLVISYIVQILINDPEHSALCSLLSALLLGLPLIFNALKDLWEQRMEMNELAALSFTASFATGEYQIAAVIAFFLIVSQLIEYRSQLGARKNLEALLNLSPETAYILRDDMFVEINAVELKAGDFVQIRPGDKVPGDGIIIEGFTSIDESAITGESIPVEKSRNDSVFGGTINLSGLLLIKISADGRDSLLSKIKKLIIQAEKSRSPVMRLINRYISWYTPVILMISGIVLFFTHDISRTISMLIIACPCTILLSSPTAFVAALTSAARLGVIIKNLDVLEIAAKVKTVVFDKTGTLTNGVLTVDSILNLNGYSEEEVLVTAASLEQNSTHPVGKAIVREAHRRNLALKQVASFNEYHGLGVSGTIDEIPVSVGREEWIIDQCQDTSYLLQQENGKSRICISYDKRVMGTVELADTLKPDAPQVIQNLSEKGFLKVIMLSGDRKKPSERIARQLGCEVRAEVLPHEKMSAVQELINSGETVAVVGDGVNDAPALAAADISIAMGAAGSDVAIHSASIVLMNDELNRIPYVFRLSRGVISTVKQNLIFSILYILALFFLSAGGFISPLLAVILHTLSSVFVVFNSARLLRVDEEMV